MAGKGRTGLMVCSYLVYCGMSADDALEFYAQKRTTNNRGVSIPSQLRYVKYWSKLLAFPRGAPNSTPDVKLPRTCTRELLCIRLCDAISINYVYFVVAELEANLGQSYSPPTELARNYCRQTNSGYRRNDSHQQSVSSTETERSGELLKDDTTAEQKTCLDHNFDMPLPVSGDVRVTFYEKLISGRYFYLCFNTAFITSNLLQLPLQELDKVGRKAKYISGPSFRVELVFAPENEAQE